PFKAKGRAHEKCGCPIWADPRPQGPLKSLRTTDRARARELAREMEDSGRASPSAALTAGPMTITEAKEAFFANLTVRNLSAATKYKHEILWRQCLAFAEKNRLEFVADLDATMIDRFVKSWNDKANSRGKKLERFRQFFKFAVSRKWIEEDPTEGMKGPKVRQGQTPPFTPNEIAKILATAETRIEQTRNPEQKANASRARALIVFLLFSGLRIIDAVGCQIEWVKGGRVRLVARKNGAHIDVRLPSHVMNALTSIPPASDLYFFWTGNGQIETAVKDWQGRLLQIFRDAGIDGGHAHRFRDTFACAMLERGESLQAVANALGNSLLVTQRHYNPWSTTRQDRQDASVESSWKDNPVLKLLDDQEKLAKEKGARVM
ncbi:MAG TPA: tyrosine-type recombinase/integrase, partial [Candidatus Acidoferrum sp.]|nr:tyrosine-type recombinase/integrase [Candidatus Acidoferrum sp.]